jgi:hypothetical protein
MVHEAVVVSPHYTCTMHFTQDWKTMDISTVGHSDNLHIHLAIRYMDDNKHSTFMEMRTQPNEVILKKQEDNSHLQRESPVTTQFDLDGQAQSQQLLTIIKDK